MPCIADAHADSLMWNRDLTRFSSEGHVDFPRLAEAKVGLQCFTLVTRGLPVIGGFPLFGAYRGWPRPALAGEWARALWQIERLNDFCRRSAGMASVARTAAELEANLAAGRLSAVLGVEGAHALEGQVARVGELRARGVRFMGLTHLSNNELGGSSTPFMGDRPLSAHGREVLDEMARLGMPVDVAHASPRALDDILSHPTARPFCSHTGVSGVTPKWRNLPDAALRRIADKGGVVGVIFAPQFLGGRELSDLVRHLEHAVKVMGAQGVGFGSDFDGMVPLPRGMRDVRDLPLIMAALRERGHPQALVDQLAGENWRRFFGEVLGS
jgi:membrane dipeptidase